MISSLLFVLLMVGKTDTWTESSTTKVFPNTLPGVEASAAVRIYAARGERESFQICIRAEKKAISGAQLRVGALDKQIGPPEVRRVGYAKVTAPLPRPAAPEQFRWPDPLLDMQAFDVPARETRAVWVTYEIPRSAKPGVHTGELELVFNKTIKQAIPVTIEVFDLELPETPTFDAFFTLDRLAVSDRYGMRGNTLDEWKPAYDTLKSYPISFSLSANGDLLRVAQDGAADSSELRQHLEYVMKQSHMSVIDAGMGERGIALFPEPLSTSQTDPLGLYLHVLADWLVERSWLDKACVIVASPAERIRWPEARARLERIQRADSRVRRLMRGPLHPYWERYTDIWAVTLANLDASAAQRLRQGESLATAPAYPAEISGSSAGIAAGAGWGTTPRDAYDGSAYTFWSSAGAPSRSGSEWLRIDFADTVKLDSLSVVWQPGLEASEIRLETSFDGEQFSTATTRWQGHDAAGSKGLSWTEGTLSMVKPTRAVRLTFLATVSAGPVGVREVVVGAPNENAPVTQIQAPELWMALNPIDFPCLAVDAVAGEARLIPWICWAKGLSGFLSERLNHWPRNWDEALAASGADWEGNDNWSSTLVYPGARALFPSIRLELLRDGVEDYEYLAAADKAVRDGRLSEGALREICPRKDYTAQPTPATVNGWANEALKARVRLGRALSQLSKSGSTAP